VRGREAGNSVIRGGLENLDNRISGISA
jgi:hypothetical protein